MPGTAPTYDQLERKLTEHPSLPRNRAALRLWQREQGGEFDDRAETLTFVDDASFEEALKGLLDKARADGRISFGSVNGYRSGVRAVRGVAREMADVRETEADSLPSVIRLCRRRLGITGSEFARRYGRGALDWQKGTKTPSSRSAPVMRQIAADAGVDESLLLQWLPRPKNQHRRRGEQCHENGRHDIYGLSAHGYRVPGLASHNPDLVELPQCQLREDLEYWISFKTADVPPGGLTRLRQQTWTPNARDETKTQDSVMKHVSGFFGWLHSLGVQIEDMTLAMAGDGVLLAEFDEFLHARGSKAQGRNAAQSFASLMLGVPQRHPDVGTTGFVRQQRRVFWKRVAGDNGYLRLPQVRECYANKFRGLSDQSQSARDLFEEVIFLQHDVEDKADLEEKYGRRLKDRDLWDMWCAEHHKFLRQLGAKDRTHGDDVSPLEKVNRLIRSTPERREQPLRVVQDVMDQIRVDIARNGSRRTKRRLETEVDLFMVAFAVALPVREQNARLVRLAPDLLPEHARAHLPSNYEPSLSKDENGQYWFCEHRRYFKNRKSMEEQGITYYRVPLPGWVHPIIDWYLSDVRPRTAGGQAGSRYLHLQVSHNGRNDEQMREPLSRDMLGRRMARILKTYLEVPDPGENALTPLGDGLRYHWIRHLVATDLLATHPEAVRFVAHILNDRLETICAAYDTSQPADAYRYAGRHQDSVLG